MAIEAGKKEEQESKECKLCGKIFVPPPCYKSEMCPECKSFIRRGARLGQGRKKKVTKVVRESKIGELVAAAKDHGMIYGEYTGILRQTGREPAARIHERYISPAWAAWKAKLYAIIKRQYLRNTGGAEWKR